SFASAFEDSARALAIAPRHVDALHVRALVLESMSLRDDAIDAWDEYLREDPHSSWATEARARRAALQRRAPSDPTHALLQAADAGDRATLPKFIDGRPQYARALVEETLLGAWADAIEKRDDVAASRALQRCLTIAPALASSSDGMALAAVERIVHADRSSLGQLAKAHRSYTAARAAFAAASDMKAHDALAEAARLLDAARSPLAARAWISYATVSHYFGHSDEAREVLQRVVSSLSGHEAEYPVATGEAWWMLGLVEQSQGRSAAALHDYDTARVSL